MAQITSNRLFWLNLIKTNIFWNFLNGSSLSLRWVSIRKNINTSDKSINHLFFNSPFNILRKPTWLEMCFDFKFPFIWSKNEQWTLQFWELSWLFGTLEFVAKLPNHPNSAPPRPSLIAHLQNGNLCYFCEKSKIVWGTALISTPGPLGVLSANWCWQPTLSQVRVFFYISFTIARVTSLSLFWILVSSKHLFSFPKLSKPFTWAPNPASSPH